MELWLDAKNINGGENLNLNNGASISIWKDLSGKANHLSQEITQKRPIFSLYGLNNYPVVKFDGIKSSEGDYLENSNGFEISDELTIFVVTNKTNYGGAYEKIFALRGDDGSHGLLLSEGPSPYNLYVYVKKPPSSYRNIISNESHSGPKIFVSRIGNNILDFDISGKNVGTKDYNDPIQGSDNLKLGWAYGSEFWDGELGEVLLFNRYLTTDEKIKIN